MKIKDNKLDMRIFNMFVKGERFIELGCGAGFSLDKFQNKFNILFGLDISKARLINARPNLKNNNWTFILHDLNKKIPFSDNDFDGVYSNQVVEHIINPLHFFKEIYRVLNTNGMAIVTTPNIRYIKHIYNLIFSGNGPRTANLNTFDGDWDDGHLHYFTHKDLYYLAKRAGFKNIHSFALIKDPERNVIRKFLNYFKNNYIIKNFLSGNIVIILKK